MAGSFRDQTGTPIVRDGANLSNGAEHPPLIESWTRDADRCASNWIAHRESAGDDALSAFVQRDDEADLLSKAFEVKRVPNLVPKSAVLSPTDGNSEPKDGPDWPQGN
jgi:hypothetical protein